MMCAVTQTKCCRILSLGIGICAAVFVFVYYYVWTSGGPFYTFVPYTLAATALVGMTLALEHLLPQKVLVKWVLLLLLFSAVLASGPYWAKRWSMKSSYAQLVPVYKDAELVYEEFQVVPVTIGSYVLRAYRTPEFPEFVRASLERESGERGWQKDTDGVSIMEDGMIDKELTVEVLPFPTKERGGLSLLPFSLQRKLSGEPLATYIITLYRYGGV